MTPTPHLNLDDEAPEPATPPEAISQGADEEAAALQRGARHSKPTAQRVTKPKAADHGSTGPAVLSDESAEAHVLACCFLDEGPTLDRASASLTADSFYHPQHAIIFRQLCALRADQKPITPDTLLTERAAALAGVNPMLLVQLTDPSKYPTTAHAGYMIARVADLAAKRTILRSLKDGLEQIERGVDLADLAPQLQALSPQRATSSANPARPITSYAYPAEDDPNILLGSDDYLGRGGGLLFVSHAGAGKSSWAMDACMMWALGRAWMGIKCHQPRKTLIIQAEDSDRYIGKIFASFAHVNKLTPDELALLAANCVIIRLKGVSGPAFFAELKRLTDLHQPDLVVINPIYLYAEGDITRSEFAQPFLLGLDAANKAEKFAYILIHHTGKPSAKGKDGKRAEVEDWESAYMGFGSSYLANWPRCTVLLEPVPGATGRYQIKLGKGGYNAGVTKEVAQGTGFRLEPVTRIAIRHSTSRMQVGSKDRPVYYWELDDTPTEESDAKPRGGRPKEYTFDTFAGIFPHAADKAITRNALHRFATDLAPIKETAFRDMLTDAVQRGELARITKHNAFMYYMPVPGGR